MIRMAHFADVHVGVENYGRFDPKTGLSTRVEDFLKRFDEIVEFSAQNDVDLALFAGDAFKTYQPNPTLQREFAHRIRDFAAICPVVLLIGNHDQPPSVTRAFSTEIYDTLGVPNVIVGWDYRLHRFETKSGPVQVATAPYPTRSRLLSADETRTLNHNQIEALAVERVRLLLQDLAQQAATSDAPRVLAGHFAVTGAEVGADSMTMLGRDLEIPLGEVADPTWDYVALGHIHKHQNLTRGRDGLPPVVYSGSPEAIDFGEEREPKGFCWVELERGRTRWQFQRLHSRLFFTIRLDLRGILDPTNEAIEMLQARAESGELGGSIVRIQVCLDSDNTFEEKVVRAYLERAGVYFLAIDRQVERARRTRLEAAPEGFSDLELLDRYLIMENVSEDRRELLRERAQALFEEVARR